MASFRPPLPFGSKPRPVPDEPIDPRELPPRELPMMSKARDVCVGALNLLVFGFGWWTYAMAIYTHGFAVDIAPEQAGDGGGWLTFLLPFASETYWLVREATRLETWNNPFSWAVGWTLGFFAIAVSCSWLSLRLSRGYVPRTLDSIVRDDERRQAIADEEARIEAAEARRRQLEANSASPEASSLDSCAQDVGEEPSPKLPLKRRHRHRRR